MSVCRYSAATVQATRGGVKRSSLTYSPQRVLRYVTKRFINDKTLPGSSSSRTRLDKIETRLPNFLRKYVRPLRAAPVSHVTSFIILHEITAIVPLLGLAGLFRYFDWVPIRPEEWEWGRQGVSRSSKWARKKGLINDDAAGEMASRDTENEAATIPSSNVTAITTSPIIVDLAAAWALTKALLPVRLLLSVWATPWFASRIVLPVTRLFRR